MKKLIILLAVILVLVSVFIFWFFKKAEQKNAIVNSFKECTEKGYPIMESYPRQCKTPDGKTFTEYIGNILEKQDLIRITQPRPNDTVSSPLDIKGEARGYWFFEASFPVKLYDGNNNLLVAIPAQAKSDWMTENFVPFEAIIEFQKPTTQNGTLVLEKDNPSDLPQNADQLIIPVYFSE